MLCYVMLLNNIMFLYTIFIIQNDKIYEIKENKKDNNLKIQNIIASIQSRVPKIHQPKVEMQEK